MITIGELARFGQTSVRTVRHYHQLGILAEPDRDASGYRVYGSADLIRLLQIRNLADAGVPLADIPDVLDAEDASRSAAFERLDEQLRQRELVIRRQRDRLARVRDALGGPPVPAPIAAAWQRLEELGLSSESLREEHESTLLLGALYGVDRSTLDGFADAPLGGLYEAILDPELDDGYTVAMYRRVDEVRHLPADDPRVDALVEETVGYLLSRPELHDQVTQIDQSRSSEASARMLQAYVAALPPALARMISESEQRVREHLESRHTEETS